MSPGERAHALLLPLLDADQYHAVAVVHGLTPSAVKAFDLCKQVLADQRGVVWVTDPDLLAVLRGASAARMQQAFRPEPRKVVTFLSVRSGRSNWSLSWHYLTTADLDAGFVDAELDR